MYTPAVVRVALKGETWAAFSFCISWTDLVFGGVPTGTLLGGGAGNRFFPFWRGQEWYEVKGRKTGGKNKQFNQSFLNIIFKGSVFANVHLVEKETVTESDGNEEKY